MEKYHNGIISRTHFSDLLRLCILAEHGGLWLDATFYCAHPIDEYVELPLFSIKRPGYDHRSVACGMFANYSLSCSYNLRYVFSTIRDYWFEYWRTNDFLIDYLLTDYFIVLAQKHNPAIAQAFSNIKPNNPRCDDLVKSLASPFDQRLWDELKSDTSLFKLTWKQQFPSVVEGKDTFYARLLQQKL